MKRKLTSCSRVLSLRSISLIAESSFTIPLYTTASSTTQLSLSAEFNFTLDGDESGDNLSVYIDTELNVNLQ